MKQIFLASTLFELTCLAAGVDSGDFDTAVEPAVVRTSSITQAPECEAVSERLLLTTNNASVMEQVVSLSDIPSAATLLRRFDRIISLNELVAPQHPSSWSPAEPDLPMLERLIRREWQLGDEAVELILESPQVNPAIALGRIFRSAPIRIYSDGLMSYGPTRNNLPLSIAQRVTSLHYLPLMGDLKPLLLSEAGILQTEISTASVTDVIDELATTVDPGLDGLLSGLEGARTGFAVGQYLSALGLLESSEEDAMHRSMLKKAAEAGCTTVLFKPHPAAPLTARSALANAARSLGLRLEFVDSPIVAEAIISRLKPRLVVGLFSTALVSARNIYGIPIEVVGAEKLLGRIAPFQNSNRIPLTIVDWLDRVGDRQLEEADYAELQALIDAVGYCMQPLVVPHLRQPAESFLASELGRSQMRYFKRRRLMKLDLPGGLQRTRNPKTIARRLGGIGYRLGKHRLNALRKRR